MVRVGFQFQETMSGTYTLASEPGSQRPFRFSGRVVAGDVLQHVKDHKARLEGTLHADGLAEEAAIEGTLEIAPFTKKIIRYEFSFQGRDGKSYHFVGQKNIRFSDFLGTMTHLRGTLLNAQGAEVGQADLRFNVRSDLLGLLRSLGTVFTS